MAAVDIIIPVYNVEKYIDACMESILSQTYRDYRVILIDDGSTDQSPLVCDRYAHLYNNIIVKHKENGGLSSARNVGLNMVEAPYYIFVDSDDYLRKDTLEILLKILEKEDADVVKFGIAMTDEQGVAKEPLQATSVGEVSYQTKSRDKEWLFTFGHATAKLYRSQSIKGILFPEGLYYEDYYWAAVVSQRVTRLVEVDAKLYFYRVNPQSITHKPNPRHKNDKYEILDLIISQYKSENMYAEYETYIEYLYTMVCFFNYCKIAVINERLPYATVHESSERIKERFPHFMQNSLYQRRLSRKGKFMTAVMLYWPYCFVVGAKFMRLITMNRRKERKSNEAIQN